MSKIVLSVLVVLLSHWAVAQVGIGTPNPNPKAVLDLASPTNNQGFLVPRLTTGQRTAIALTASDKGLLVFDTDANRFFFSNGSAWVAIEDVASGSGTVTSIATGTGLSGGPITTTGTISLTNTAVAPGSYGSATQVPTFTVDAQGRLTAAGNTTITGVAPGGAAGGDLTGTYPNPTVVNSAITSAKIADGTIVNADIGATAAIGVSKLAAGANGQILTTTAGIPQWSTLSLGTVTSVATGTGLTGGPITATGTIALANTAVTPGSYGSATQVSTFTVDAQGRLTAAGNTAITGVTPGGAAAGDLTGTYPAPLVANNAITSAKIADGTIATIDLADGSVNTNKILDGTIATADLADGSVNSLKILDGSIVNADIGATAAIGVAKLAAGANGQILTTTAGTPQWSTLSLGTVTSVATGTGLTGGPITATGTIALANTAVTPGSYGSATQVPAFTVDAQGRLTAAGNTTITGVAPGGAAGGDLTGTYPNPVVSQIQNRPVLNTLPASGQVLKWNGSAWAPGNDDNSAFSLPYFASLNATGTTPVFQINNDGTTNARVGQFNITNASNTQSALAASTLGTGAAIVGNGTFLGVAGTTTTIGGAAGYFLNSADRGFGAIGYLNTAGSASYGVLGTTYLNDGTYFGVGVEGVGDDYGIRARGGIFGGEFTRTGGTALVRLAGGGASVYSSSNDDFTNAVTGAAFGASAYGVYGSGTAAGVAGYSDNGNAIDGYSNSTTTGYAVYGRHGQTTGTNAAIRGETSSTAANAEGVTGVVLSTTPGASSAGVRGINNGTAGFGIGVWGSHAGSGWGVYGSAALAAGYAGYFSGRVNVTGALSKGSGTFKIDHPLDPTNKYLYHSFVESPDMKNIYDGVVVLGADGDAEITLPEWFDALNRDFRYQLTCVGGFANVYIAQEIQNNRFRIAGGRQGLKVSWQVTGIRKDPYAEKNRVKVEEEKPANERGKYLYPEAYGQPVSMGVDYAQINGSNSTSETKPAPSAEEMRQRNAKMVKPGTENQPKSESQLKPLKLN
ncbi:MAG: hypothetical protein J0L66_17050 [Cytophagales bacterium]|nr:hypothetical protein [Cytophagales bacterium]